MTGVKAAVAVSDQEAASVSVSVSDWASVLA
jgi:hypothetical protein